MEKKISPYQLLASMFIVPYGSAILFYLASEAKEDAWLSIIFYIGPAILLQLIYLKLFQFYPNDTLVTYLPKIFGKFMGNLLNIIYILYFLYESTRVLRDFSYLIVNSSMSQTPVMFIAALIILTVIYGVITGIETLCRASEILFPLMLLGIPMAFLLLFISGDILRFNELVPILGEGVFSPIKKSWQLITFPYGQFFVFTMMYKDVNEPHKIKKYVIGAVAVEGIALALISIIFITALGPSYASTSTFPLLETLRLIKIGGFLERLDILIITTMVTAGFMKISLFMYFGILGITEIFKIKERKILCVFIGIVLWICSELIAKSFPQHLKIGLDFTIKYLHLPLQIGVPLLALLIAWFKNKNKNSTAI